MIKERARGFWRVDVPNKGTQFRSRDIYPKAVTDFIYGNSVIGAEIDPATIPDPPTDRLGFVDGYGNLKTTKRDTEWPEDLVDQDKIAVTINGITHDNVNNRVTREGDFREGELYVQTGSWGGIKNPFIEIVYMVREAVEIFKIDPKRYRENLIVEFSRKK